MIERLVPITLLALAACTADLRGVGSASADPGFGRTIGSNIAAQAIDMDPHYAGVPVEGGSGQRNVDALKRYQTGMVKQLEKVTGKSEVGGQGGATSVSGETPK